MRNYIIKRIAQSVLILFCVMFIIYALIRSLPSSFAETMAMQLAQAPGAKPYEEWLAQLNAPMILVVSILFSVLEKGAGVVQSTYGISSNCAAVLQGIILFFILGCEFFVRYTVVPRGKGGCRNAA